MMISGYQHYILRGRKVVPVTMLEWAKWFEKANRVIKKSEGGGYLISTVFIGIHEGEIFETMVFKGDSMDEQWMDRCKTYKKALEMHKRGVAWAIQHMGPTK